MSDSSRLPTRGSSSPAPPPPPPPAPVQQSKYSNRAASALARFAQPFFSGSRPPSPQASGVRADLSAGPCSNRSKSLPGASQTVTHKTGIPIAALDISPQRTHAVVGGKEILKTIRVSPDHSSEEFNLRNAIIGYSSTQNDGSGLSARYKDQLTVRDVKWSHGNYDTIIATAVANGRIVLYDLQRTGLEYCRFQGHSRQVHKLAFNPHRPAWLLSGSQDSSIRMWDLRMASAVRPCSSKELYNGNSDAVRDIRWSPNDGFAFATATDSGAIQLWDCRKTTAPLLRITAHDKPCFSVDWHPDGKHIVSGETNISIPDTPGRWECTMRPPSWNNEHDTSGGWQSIQLVTSYDKEDPRIHLWDLRRPHIPFREFDRYESHAADLLWHSKDLLWTAGEAGVFTQTDIRYAPQVVNQRPMCSLAWSPSGEVLAFVQKRTRHSTVRLSTTEFMGHPEEGSSSAEALSHSPAEDFLDEPSFISVRHRRTKSSSGRASKSLGSTPPGAPEFNPVLSLEKVLSKIKPSGQYQLGAVGSIPGATMDQGTFRYLARHYAPLLRTSNSIHSDLLRSLLESLSLNADCAEDASLVKLSQTWRIVKFAVIQELQLRAREQRQAPEKSTRGIRTRLSAEGQNSEKPRALDEGKPEKVKNRLFKGVMETEVTRQPLVDVENASNMTTPLAQPLPDCTILSSDSSISHMASLDDPTDIQPLPPSLLSPNQGTMNSNDWSSMSDVEPRMHRQSNASEDTHFPGESLPSDPLPGLVSQTLEDDQRSAPRAITGRGDWRARSRTETSEVDEYDQKMEDKKAAIRDYKQYPKKILSLESHVESVRPPGFRRRESSESLPMFSASTGSSHPSKSIGTSLSSAAKLYDVSESENATEGAESEAPRIPYSRTRSDSVIGPVTVQNEERQASEPFVEGVPDSNVHLERPSSPLPLMKESSPLETPCFEKNGRQSVAYTAAADSSTCRATHVIDDDLTGLIIPISSAGTMDKPWSAGILLKEAIRHYHSSSCVDVQSAAHLLQKMRTLFQSYEDILPREECELIFKTYNEHLIRQCMYIEAAELRLLCVPVYPAVYEYAQVDTTMNVFCFTCKRPYENPLNDNTRCHRCNTPQEPCAICMSVDPPAEWVAEHSVSPAQSNLELDSETSHFLSSSRSSIKTEPIPTSELRRLDETYAVSYNSSGPKGSALWTWCQGCGHGGHLACISMWLNDTSVSEGGCATPGCMHDCGPGPRREHNRTILLEESKRRDSAGRKAGVGFVKRDPWTRGESKAVEKVRGMLSIGTSGGTSASTTSAGPSVSSNLMSPKKVRLVTPSEQGKRRGTSSRSSLGGGSGLST
ncbi:WD repeat protein [Aspergillus nomiae NRRL 13137]|uniref:WD repeat protein n=1 Tax=Aspergillus nomiae NRRL (strain ATCC 15546 / NRRL 13137 / CBS 260.88 / M93) TaxID=1509407 RepID=A0A0L1JEL1_ASPN3|nr:WD repeat protein [Aspergillus nomiae NRRL 13137]KNG89818.1 WD repeat protein [Aspergillus nomiae NRRL 13137]